MHEKMEEKHEHRKRKLQQDADRTCNIIIFVYVYGKITHKIFDIWQKSMNQINEKSSNQIVMISEVSKLKLSQKVYYLVVDNDEFIPTDSLNKFITKDTKIVRKEWIIESLKAKVLQSPDTYIIQKSVSSGQTINSTQNSNNNNNDNNNNNNNDTYPDLYINKLSGNISSNQYIIDILKSLENFYSSNNDHMRVLAYRKSCQILSKLPPITTTEQLHNLKSIPGIGKSIYNHIVEIATTGHLTKLDNYKSDPRKMALENLTTVWGIGPQSATDLYNKGIKSVDDLRSKNSTELQSLLTEQQIIGLSRYDDISQRMPRSEVTEIYNYVSSMMATILPHTTCICCGSYRRNKQTCGDIDILISPPEGYNTSLLLLILLYKLTQSGFLTDHLALPSYHQWTIFNIEHQCENNANIIEFLRTDCNELDDNNVYKNDDNDNSNCSKSSNHIKSPTRKGKYTESHDGNDYKKRKDHMDIIDRRCSYMGVCKLPHVNAVYRRIDIKSYNQKCLPFALLYFTGSDIFNRSMRYYCTSKLNLKLSDKGLRHCIKGSNGEEDILGIYIPCQTEKDIFDVLGLDYKEPPDREGPVMKNGVNI